jgi:hypothetical protein
MPRSSKRLPVQGSGRLRLEWHSSRPQFGPHNSRLLNVEHSNRRLRARLPPGWRNSKRLPEQRSNRPLHARQLRA